jgi:hypothetical protein
MHHLQININRYIPRTQTLQILESYARLPLI